jgi:hypothetical protein
LQDSDITERMKLLIRNSAENLQFTRPFPASKLYVRASTKASGAQDHHHRARDYDLCHGVFIRSAPEPEACEGVSGPTTAKGKSVWFSLCDPVIHPISQQIPKPT